MSNVPVTLRAEVASTELSVQEILSLAPGSVLRFSASADEGVTLFAENVKLARAEAGAAGPRRAVQIRGPEREPAMSVADASHRDALLRLGAATAEAVARVLETFAPGAVERGDVTVYGEDEAPLSTIVRGAVTASVSYIDGVTGANIFVLPPAGARALAGAMGAPAPMGRTPASRPRSPTWRSPPSLRPPTR